MVCASSSGGRTAAPSPTPGKSISRRPGGLWRWRATSAGSFRSCGGSTAESSASASPPCGAWCFCPKSSPAFWSSTPPSTPCWWRQIPPSWMFCCWRGESTWPFFYRWKKFIPAWSISLSARSSCSSLPAWIPTSPKAASPTPPSISRRPVATGSSPFVPATTSGPFRTGCFTKTGCPPAS